LTQKNTQPKTPKPEEVLLMEEILHQLIGSSSHSLQGFMHPRWCRISAINRMTGRLGLLGSFHFHVLAARLVLGGKLHRLGATQQIRRENQLRLAEKHRLFHRVDSIHSRDFSRISLQQHYG